jgi:hypothetical protein
MVRHFLSDQCDTLHDSALRAAAAVRKENAEKQAVVRNLSQAGDADTMCQAGRYRSKGLYGTTIVSVSIVSKSYTNMIESICTRPLQCTVIMCV